MGFGDAWICSFILPFVFVIIHFDTRAAFPARLTKKSKIFGKFMKIPQKQPPLQGIRRFD
jgi:hypothetical protein